MKIGILYNLVENIQRGKEIDVIADNEVYQTAIAVRDVLGKKYNVELIKINGFNIQHLKGNFDFIFNLAEGLDGDNLAEPEIAASLEKLNIPFSGSGEYALRLCLDKVKVKNLLLKEGINTPRFQVFTKNNNLECILNFPLIVKPIHEDGSIGITFDSVVYNHIKLRAKIDEILKDYKQPALVEEYIDGREINTALIGNGDLKVLPLSEINFNFLDNTPRIVSFEAKWIKDSFEYKNTIGKCPIEISENIKEKIIYDAKRAFKITGCDDYARVDFRVRGEEVYVLEVNPNPCINLDSGFVRSAKVTGYCYDDLINKIFEMAYVRNKQKV